MDGGNLMLPDQSSGRALAIASLLRMGYPPAKVAEAVRVATEQHDAAKAMDVLRPLWIAPRADAS